jgi:hypothetical protein
VVTGSAPKISPSRLALAGQRFARLGSCLVADFRRRTGNHFGDPDVAGRPADNVPLGIALMIGATVLLTLSNAFSKASPGLSKQTCVGRPTLRPLRFLFGRRFSAPNR